jgi:hypothetical protein
MFACHPLPSSFYFAYIYAFSETPMMCLLCGGTSHTRRPSADRPQHQELLLTWLLLVQLA